MAEKAYTVLVCDPEAMLPHLDPPVIAADGTPGRDIWLAHEPISASSADKAIEKLWEMAPDLKMCERLLYVAIPNLRARQNKKQIIEKWGLGFADEPDPEPAQEQLA